MMKFSKKQLALAVGAALGAAGLIPSAQAVNLATDGLGQVMIFPYYTTRAGWNTLFNITNTSDQVVAVKVNIREAYNSRDVLDFDVILSPRDVWTAWVENGPDDIPQIVTNDNSCTVPRLVPGVPQPFQGNGANGLLAYTGAAADGGPTGTGRMREGYVTMLMMGSSPATGLAANAVHNSSGIPKNCDALRAAFSDPAGYVALNTAGTGFPNYAINPLKGMFSLVNAEAGQNAGGSAVTLASFRSPTPAPASIVTLQASIVTLQLPPDQVVAANPTEQFAQSFHEPTINAGNTLGQVLLADGTLSTAPDTDAAYFGADQVSWVLLRDTVNNHWTKRVDPTKGWLTASDWVVTFPTKAFFADQGTTEYSAINPFRGPRITQGPLATSPFSKLFANGKSCDPVTYRIFNREEKEITREQGPVFSPAPTPEGNTLCYEVNVLTFDGSRILDSAAALTGNVNQLPGLNGWMRLNLASAANALPGRPISAQNPGFGLPVVGFSITTRTAPDGVLLNEAYLIDHSYTRRVPFGLQIF